MGAKLTKGTQVYFIDPDTDLAVPITEVTGFNPGGMPSDQIEVTALDDDAKEFLRGMRTPGAATIEINPDPENASHARLHALFLDDDVESIPFCVGWADGTAAPTVDSDGLFDETAVARTMYYFAGYIADFPFDFSINAVVKSTISVQRTGEATWVSTT